MPRGSIFYWEARRRLEALLRLREDVQAYFGRARWSPHTGWNEDDDAHALRRRINEEVHDAQVACGFVGVATDIYYIPPPAVGGPTGNIPLLENIFNLPRFGIPHEQVIDRLDRAIGVYRSWLGPLWRKLFNPFYWLCQLLVSIAEIPFRILGAAGFNKERAEESVWGKLTKAVIQFLTAIGALLGILQQIGLLGLG